MSARHTALPVATLRWESREVEGDLFATRVSDDGALVGCTISDGQVAVYSSVTGRLSYLLEQSSEHFPATSIRFNTRVPKSFLVSSADGLIREWSTHRFTITWTINESPNQIFALDLSPEESSFATAGLDKVIRLYDYETQKIKSTLQRTTEFGDDMIPGHTNRIFSLLFHPTDQNLLYSGGWDDSIQIWDLRTNRSIRSVFGAHICSDTLDATGHLLLSGSWRTKDQLQIWDLRTFAVSQTLKWEGDPQCLVYAAKFHPNGTFIAAGGSGSNEVRLISLRNPGRHEKVLLDGTTFSLCFSKDGKELVVGTQKGGVKCFQLGPKGARSSPFLTDVKV
jgi:WD40 repeat protein